VKEGDVRSASHDDTELLAALEDLVSAAAVGPSSAAADALLDGAVRRWARDVATPRDVVDLAARLPVSGRVTKRRSEVVQRVVLVGVDAVSTRQVHEALTDPVTGLGTRARLEHEVRHLVGARVREGVPLTAVVLDVDGLKALNDRQGHGAGDAALAEVGRAVRQHLRLADRAFRWGGDEFVVLLPGTTEAGGRALVARIQASCGTPLSAGVAEHTGGDSDLDLVAWFGAADADLYRRREASRRTRVRAGAGLPASALVGLVTVAASTVGFFGAGNVATSLGLRHDPAQQVVTGLPDLGQLPGIAEPRPTHGLVTGSVRPAVSRPHVTVAKPVVRPALPHLPVAVPTALPTPRPTVLPTALPTALPTLGPAPEPEPAPEPASDPGLVGGLLQTVRDVVTGVVGAIA
jgi:diguanylate cyclase (GGDEF)-like protein